MKLKFKQLSVFLEKYAAVQNESYTPPPPPHVKKKKKKKKYDILATKIFPFCTLPDEKALKYIDMTPTPRL